jgi:hypothetical protein
VVHAPQATSPAKQRKRNKQMILFGFKSVQILLFSFPPGSFFLLPMAELVVVVSCGR